MGIETPLIGSKITPLLDGREVTVGNPVNSSKDPDPVENSAHASRVYSSNTIDDEEARVAAFLVAFAADSHIYGLINTLNNFLKGVLREMRETEASIRIKKYNSQFEIALKKRDHIIEESKKIKDLAYEAADKKMHQAIVSGVGGIIGGGLGFAGVYKPVHAMSFGAIGQGASQVGESIGQIFESQQQKLQADMEDLRNMLDAQKTEFDAEMTVERQQSELAGSMMSFIDSINNAFSALINETHRSHSGAFSAIARTIA